MVNDNPSSFGNRGGDGNYQVGVEFRGNGHDNLLKRIDVVSVAYSLSCPQDVHAPAWSSTLAAV